MTKNKVCCIIGTGLIGGSISYAIRKHKLASHIIGVDTNKANANKALALGIVHEVLPLRKAIPKCDYIILAVPVHTITQLLPIILNHITTQVVIDTGSTKANIIQCVQHHTKRKQYVATHPMWGTEHSGPSAAMHNAFTHKAVVICNKNESSAPALAFTHKLYTLLGMHILYMTAQEHDMHTAYISHISHITSFALANTVLQKEQKTNTIFELASGGFESTVRLAKSNAAMWVPIFINNKKNILDVLMELEVQLAEFKKAMLNNDEAALAQLIIKANKIKKILK